MEKDLDALRITCLHFKLYRSEEIVRLRRLVNKGYRRTASVRRALGNEACILKWKVLASGMLLGWYRYALRLIKRWKPSLRN